MSANTIYWYDFETFGGDPRRDRAAQFAGIRTDENLEIVGDPQVFYCKPASDFLPDPMSCVITGITPQKAENEGMVEAEFIRRIHKEFSTANTCVAGYNNIRFDDELTRQLLYRNFYDPYEREWKDGNSRWDIIDMVRLCAATRPEGITWPKKEDGSNSFRLEHLTAANGIDHGAAHDALSDVLATIALARLVRQQQPKLLEYSYQLRDKKKVAAEIDLVTRKPLLHVSVMYPASLGCLALVMPICVHPRNSNGIIVYDLRENPTSWLTAGVDEIRRRIYTPAADLADESGRIPLKTVHLNKCPMIASPAVLSPERAREYQVDLDQCREHWQQLQNDKNLSSTVRAVFDEDYQEQESDPDFMIYSGGFFSDADRALMQTVRNTNGADLARLDLPFRDARLPHMLLRYRARNYPHTLSAAELEQWQKFRRDRLFADAAQQRFGQSLAQAKNSDRENSTQVVAEVEGYVRQLLSEF
ncbi:MAG: exodeoxyribonuclease I [Gammaproteobacteria bacterium]